MPSHDPTATGASSAATLTEPAEGAPESTAGGAAGEPPTASRFARRKRFRYTLPGAWVALAFFAVSFTPSLLPRSGVMQGLLAGVTAAIGYGFGVVGAWVWRAFADRDARPPRTHSWRVFLIAAGVVIVGALVVGWYWQDQIRDLMGLAGDAAFTPVLILALAPVLFVGLVALGRSLRRAYLALARLLSRWIGEKAARGVGWVAVVATTYFVVSGLLLGTAADLANQMFSVNNDDDKPGVVQTTSPLRSGGPDSLISWDSLGREGRSFVATGPTTEEIAAFNSGPALDPIRAFAGLDSAASAEERAKLAVEDLERAGGFDREYLTVVTSTGSGWVSPGSVDTIEYMTGGDSAIVSMQYSYLPSWISYLVDQDKAREAGEQLYDAVYEKWLELPEDARPQLLVFGESLGSFGGETAFSGEHDLSNRTAGTLLTGPPNFNTLYRKFNDGRDAGSTEVQPIYKDGRIVRFDGSLGEIVPPEGMPWDGTRILYVAHPSDPIVWWSPNLLIHKPDWLSEPRGEDVSPSMRWLPFVTFWQVSADLPSATAVQGHGHAYVPKYVQSWAQVIQPEGWDPAKQERLRQIISETS